MKKCCSKKCPGGWLTTALLIIGGLNWALVGIGLFVGKNLNVVNLIVGKVVWLEAVIYLLVGLAAIVALFGGCKCAKCSSCSHKEDTPKDMGGNSGGMGMNMESSDM